MIALIILVHKQKQYLKQLEIAIEQQTRQPDYVVFAVDRCLADYKEACDIASRHNNWTVIHTNIDWDDSEATLIGRTRDAALATLPDCHVIFTDADCLPTNAWIEHHTQYLDLPGIVATAGYRKSLTQTGEIQEDIRCTSMPFRQVSFDAKQDRIALGDQADSPMVLFGCNFGLNKEAIQYLRKRHQEAYEENRVFASIFDSAWGYEESSLGPVLYNRGGALYLLAPEHSHVLHQWHESRKTNNQASIARDYLSKLCTCLVTIIKNEHNEYLDVAGLPSWLENRLSEYTKEEQAEIANCLYKRATRVVRSQQHTDTQVSRASVFLDKNRFGMPVQHVTQKIETTPDALSLPVIQTKTNQANASVVLPLHNQANNIERIFNALKIQTQLPKELIIVADRCTDDTVSKIQAIQGTLPFSTNLLIRSVDEEGFRAGQVRNLGIEHVVADNILMIDGDCVPAVAWVESHMEVLSNTDVPCATFGLRNDQACPTSEETRPDTRTYRAMVPIFARKAPRVVTYQGIVYNCMSTWSCNLGLNKLAVEKLKQLNEGAVFSNKLTQGTWGGEDTYLGIQLWDNCGMLVATNPEKGSVYHIWHPRYASKDGMMLMQELTHPRDSSIFYTSSSKAETLENKLLTSEYADNIPGTYNIFLKQALASSPDNVLTKRALAFYSSRHVEFVVISERHKNATEQDTMYKELLRIRDLITQANTDISSYQSALKDKLTIQF